MIKRALLALALLTCTPAVALSPSQLAVVTGNKIASLFSDLTKGGLPPWLSAANTSLAMVTDATGALTYAPNNQETFSQNYSSYTKNGGTITAINGVAPDGSATASTLTGNGSGFVAVQGPQALSGPIVESWYVKAGTETKCEIWPGGGSSLAQFDLSAVTATNTGGTNAQIVSVGNGWFRISVKGSAYNGFPRLLLGNGAPTLSTSLLIWGTQVEQVTYQTTPSPYVITTSAAYYGPRLDNKLTTAANNLFTYSNTFTNAAWANSSTTVTSGFTDPLGGTAAWRLQGTTTSWYSIQNIGTTANTLVTYWVKSNTAGTQTFQIYSGTGRSATLTATTTWQQFSYVAAPGGGAFGIAAANVTADLLIYAATASDVTYETAPRSGDQVITTTAPYYANGTGLSYVPYAAGLLIEEARTNVVFPSGNLTSGWTNLGGSPSASTTLSPDSATYGTTLTALAGAGAHSIYNGFTAVAGPYTISAYAKAGTVNFFGLGTAGGGSDGAEFNLSTGNVDYTPSGVTAGMQAVGNGWYRCWITKTLTAGAQYHIAAIYSASSQVTAGWTAAGTETVLVFGAQAEQGSFPTSYVPTTTATVQRAADVVSITGPALTMLNAGQGTLFTETSDYANTANYSVIVGNSNTYYPEYFDSGGYFRTYNGSVLLVGSASPPRSPGRYGVNWSAGGRSIATDGNSVYSDASPLLASPQTSLYLGSNGSNYFIDGHVTKFALYNKRLSAGAFQSKSTVGAPLP